MSSNLALWATQVSGLLGIVGLVIYAFIHMNDKSTFKKTIDAETIDALRKSNLDLKSLQSMSEEKARHIIESDNQISNNLIDLISSDSKKRAKLALFFSIGLLLISIFSLSIHSFPQLFAYNKNIEVEKSVLNKKKIEARLLSGKIMYEDKPIEGVEVTLLMKNKITKTTNNLGIYRFNDISGAENDIVKFNAKKGNLVETGDLRLWSPDDIILK